MSAEWWVRIPWFRNFPGGPVAKTLHSQCRGLGLILGQGTGSYILQVRVHRPPLKILPAATKTWWSQIHIKWKRIHWICWADGYLEANMFNKGLPWWLMVKNPPAMQETQVQSLGQEDLLEKEMVPTSVFLPGKSHGQRSLAGYNPRGCKESDITEWLTLSLSRIL